MAGVESRDVTRTDLWLVAACTIAAIAMRWYRIDADSIWLDESASWWFATRSLSELWGDAAYWEPNPVLYYALLKFWIAAFGDSATAMRALSALASTSIVPVVYGIGRLVVDGPRGRSIAVCSALLVAVHPMQVRYGQEARAYALLSLAFSDFLFGSWEIAQSDAGRIVSTLIAVGLAVAGTAALVRRGRIGEAVLLCAAAFLPVAVAFAASYIITPILLARTMLWTEVPFVVLVACSTLWIRNDGMRVASVAAAVLVLATITLLQWGRPPKEPWRDVARVIEEESSADDLVLVHTQYVEVPLLYYRTAQHIKAQWLVAPGPFPGPRAAAGFPPGFMIRGEVNAVTLARIRQLSDATSRIWYVQRGHSDFDPQGKIIESVRNTHPFERIRVRDRETILLIEFSRLPLKPEDSSAASAPSALLRLRAYDSRIDRRRGLRGGCASRGCRSRRSA